MSTGDLYEEYIMNRECFYYDSTSYDNLTTSSSTPYITTTSSSTPYIKMYWALDDTDFIKEEEFLV